MNVELELRKRLNQPAHSFLETLEFSIKVWNSIEFVLLTKQEIIIDEFCNNLPRLKEEISQEKCSEYTETAWNKINEFLDLRYSSGAVSVPVKAKLVKVLTEEVSTQLQQNDSSWLTLNALLLTLQNTSMQSFYKSNLKEFASFVATTLKYFECMLKRSIDLQQFSENDIDKIKKVTEEIVKVLRTYIKHTSVLDEFIKEFAREVLFILCELVILLRNNDIDYSSSLQGLLQELFFDGSKTDKLKNFFAQGCLAANQPPGKFLEYQQIFDVPMHIFLLVAETVLISFRNDTELQASNFHYLFNDENGKWSIASDGTKALLNSFTYFINLLKIHDTPINFQIDNQKAFNYLGKKIERFVDLHTEQHPQEVMDLVCAAIKLNPLILEHTACPIAVKFMLIAKSGETFWQRYDELMFLLIEMFRKLSRPEKLISQLIRSVYEALTTIKLSKKLKRSFPEEQATPKRMKVDDQTAIQPIDSTKHKANSDYVALLQLNLSKQLDSVKVVSTEFNETNFLWSDIAFAFPPTVSYCYTKFISTLLSKPSLVIWKTLIFTLKDYLQALLQTDAKVSENSVFLIEFTSALLSQYFVGSRLAEQSDKMWKSIEENRKRTYEVLSDFGHAILNQEHNYRTMNAFLRLTFNVSNFDLLCWYYCPDSLAQTDEEVTSENIDTTKLDVEKSLQSLHSYLTAKEWTIIEQRITNFGKRECKANINKIYLQRAKAQQLFTNVTLKGSTVSEDQRDDLKKYLVSQTLSDIEQVKEILLDETFANWFIKNLSAEQKDALCHLLLSEPTFFKSIEISDQVFINNLIISAGKRCVDLFEFDKSAKILQSFSLENTSAGSRYWVSLIKECTNGRITAPKETISENRQNIIEYLSLINHLPIGFCPKEVKIMSFLLSTAVFCGMKKFNDTEVKTLCWTIFKKLLHFGELPNVSTHISVEGLLKIFSNEPDASHLYEIIFDRIIRDFTEEDTKFLDDFLAHLDQFEDESDIKKDEILHVSVLIVVNLSKNKKHKDYFENYRAKVFELIRNELKAKNGEVKDFVARTLPALVVIIKSALAKEEIDDDIRKLFKTFVEHSVDCRDQNAIKLMNTAINHKRVLEMNEDDLKVLIDRYWENFKDCCSKGLIDDSTKLTETILKIIIDFKSTEEWIELLKEIDEETKANIFTDKSKQQFRIISNIAKCQLNKVKGQVFSELVKRISFWINLKLVSNEMTIEKDLDIWLQLLECYTVIVDNIQIPVTFELVDDILQFLTAINIKKINVQSFGSKQFFTIFDKMISLCTALINHRHVFIMDRVPQFVDAFKDLLQTCCWYKSDREKQSILSQAEVTVLAEMAHKLEKMNKLFVKHADDVKRVAPYLLVFIINLMISNDRPTTLYPKIKTHIEYICYDLIAVCDHRTNSFILRSCNEAAKPIYESLHKEYEKYFKFKGKV